MIKKISEFKNIVGYELSVFKHGWSLSTLNLNTGEKNYFSHGENSKQSTGQDVTNYINAQESPLLVGYNNKGYSNYMLRVIMEGHSAELIYSISEYTLNTNNPPWTYKDYPKGYFNYAYTDLMDEMSERMSLKMAAGNLGMDIKTREVSLNTNRVLTQDEWIKDKQYNDHHVEVLGKLFNSRLEYLNTKIELGNMGNLTARESLPLTNAQLVAAYLVGPDAKAIEYGDDNTYDMPENIWVKNKAVKDYFLDPSKPNRLEIEIGAMPHVLSGGGLHGGVPNYVGQSDDEWEIMIADGEQFYPSIMVRYDMLSRSVKDPELFIKSVNDRLIYKDIGDDRQSTLKLVNNTVYGASGAPFNPLYDKRMANSVCYTGQLLLIDLIEKLEVLGDKIEFINSNTDGIIYRYHKSVEDEMFQITGAWQARAGIVLEFNRIKTIVQKDVNNYIIEDEYGQVHAKGAHLTTYDGPSVMNGELSIVDKALGDYLLTNTPIRDTIESASQIKDFQMIGRTGSTYESTVWVAKGKDVVVNDVNRVYATKEQGYGSLYKVRSAGHAKGQKRDKVQSVPASLIVDNENKLTINHIDKEWYIDLAEKRAKGFLGKRGKVKMETQESKRVERRTYLKLNEDSTEVRMFDRDDVLTGEWASDDTVLITKRAYDKLSQSNGPAREETTPQPVAPIETTTQEAAIMKIVPTSGNIASTGSTNILNTGSTNTNVVNFYRKRAEVKKLINKSKKELDERLVDALEQVNMDYDLSFGTESFTQDENGSTLQGKIRFVDLDSGHIESYYSRSFTADTTSDAYGELVLSFVSDYVENSLIVKTNVVEPVVNTEQVTTVSSPEVKVVPVESRKPSAQQVQILADLYSKITSDVTSPEASDFLNVVKAKMSSNEYTEDEVLRFTLEAEDILTIHSERRSGVN